MEKITTADRLREIMAETGLRQVDIINKCKPFADAFGTTINKVNLSQYLSGKYEPNTMKVAVMAMALNVSEAWLMGFDVSKERIEKKADVDFEISAEEQDLLVEIRQLSAEDRKLIKMMACQLASRGEN